MGITIIQGSTGDAEFPGQIRFESPSTELVFTPSLSSAISGPGRLVLGEAYDLSPCASNRIA
jgi:hypothetical protein